jgi:uncharacterized protein
MSLWMIRAAVAMVLAAVVQGPPPPAWGDAAAGGAAFEKGDYVRAMAEWASAAERGDPDAEFGLGMLYERGDGELRQDYKAADRWYEKAAAQGNVGAEYRLALIWAAGGDDFRADLVEAYKWILLASESGLATDVKAQLAAVLDRNQLALAEQRAAAWKQTHARQPAAVAPAAGGVSSSPAMPRASGAATATAKSGGCPGWPFPTLPCTEQFPALPGAPAQPRSVSPPSRPPGGN